MRDAERAQRTNRVAEKGVWAVEGVDEATAVVGFRPACGLHGAADFEGELTSRQQAVIGTQAGEDQAAEGAVGADIVEAVIMDADVRDMRRHELQRVMTAPVQEPLLAGGLVLQEQ